jgi:hypothetical protein
MELPLGSVALLAFAVAAVRALLAFAFSGLRSGRFGHEYFRVIDDKQVNAGAKVLLQFVPVAILLALLAVRRIKAEFVFVAVGVAVEHA